MLVAETDVPVFPCHIRGAFQALSPDRRLPRPRKLYLRVGTPLVFAEIRNDGEGWRHIAQETQAAVTALGKD